MNDWDVNEINGKLNSIRDTQQQIYQHLESEKTQKYYSSPRVRLLSGKAKLKIIAGIAVGALSLSALFYTGVFVLWLIYKI